jgi:hypothetical protein
MFAMKSYRIKMNVNYRVFQNLGMNRNVSPFLPVQGEWKIIVNADIDKVGVLSKRDGYVKFLNAPDASEILNLIPFNVGTINRMIMINATGKLYSALATDSTWGTAILTGLSTTKRWGYTIMSDDDGVMYMILGNGAVVYKTVDGVVFTSVAGAPLGRYWTQMYQRVYTSGVDADPDVLHWSSIGDLTNWSTISPDDSGSLNIDKFAKGIVQNIRAINDRIVIWKNRSVKRWDEEYLKSVMASAGLDAPYSVADIDGMALTFDREAIRLYDGNYPQNISEKIKDLIYGISKSAINLQRICGEVFRNRYHLSVGDITDEDGNVITNAWIVYDYLKNLFWLYSLADHTTAMAKFINGTTGEENLYFGDTTGQCYKMFSGDMDDDANIEMLLKSHVTYPSGAEAIITPKKMTVAGRFMDEAKVMMACDFGSPENIGELPDPVSVNLMDNFGNGVRGFELIISHATKGKPYFYGYTLNYDIGEERV